MRKSRLGGTTTNSRIGGRAVVAALRDDSGNTCGEVMPDPFPMAFVHIEKAAGTTVNRILRRSFGVNHCDVEPWAKGGSIFSQDDMQGLRKIYPHIMSIAGHSIMPHGDLGTSVRYFTFLREPIVRCASHYQYQVQVMGKTISFDEWIEASHYRNFQTRKLTNQDDVAKAISLIDELKVFVGLTENFDESLVMMTKVFCDLPLRIAYRRENVAQDASIQRELLQSPRSRRKLEEANQSDLHLYQYVKDHLYPRQRRQHGECLAEEVQAFKSANHSLQPSWRYICGLVKRNLIYKPVLRAHRRP